MSYRVYIACDINGCREISEEKISSDGFFKIPNNWLRLKRTDEQGFERFRCAPVADVSNAAKR